MPRPKKTTLVSFKHAIEGIVHVFRTQRHMRFHFAVAAVLVVLGALMKLPREQWFLLYFGAWRSCSSPKC